MSDIIKYVYEEPVFERGVEIGLRVHAYSEQQIIDEYWDVWCDLKEQDGYDRSTFKKEDCINDWIAHFDAQYVN